MHLAWLIPKIIQLSSVQPIEPHNFICISFQASAPAIASPPQRFTNAAAMVGTYLPSSQVLPVTNRDNRVTHWYTR